MEGIMELYSQAFGSSVHWWSPLMIYIQETNHFGPKSRKRAPNCSRWLRDVLTKIRRQNRNLV